MDSTDLDSLEIIISPCRRTENTHPIIFEIASLHCIGGNKLKKPSSNSHTHLSLLCVQKQLKSQLVSSARHFHHFKAYRRFQGHDVQNQQQSQLLKYSTSSSKANAAL
jgi:hypothetical protein